MKILKNVLLFAVGLLALLAVIGLLLPTQSHVERSAVITAPADTVFPLINNFHEFNRWSPWAERDSNTQYRFEGPASGVGAKVIWASDNPQVGAGSQEIVESDPNTRVASVLDFGEMGTAQAAFALEPAGEGVKVTWGFDVEHGKNLVDRYMGLLMNQWVGADYEAGLANLKALAESLPPVVTEEIDYQANGVSLKGFLAYNRAIAGERPGVLVVHEWWGHNDYARRRARELAALGYTAFALDMYGEGKTAGHPDEAMKMMMDVVNNADIAAARFNAALEVLKNQPMTDAEHIAAIGYCFGGAVVLSMARMGVADLDGVVSFHGGLGGLPPVQPDKMQAKVLVFHGGADPFVSPEQKETFKQEMQAAGTGFEFVEYPGVKHSFTNPEADRLGAEFNLPLKYDAEADANSWNRMQAFLYGIFKS